MLPNIPYHTPTTPQGGKGDSATPPPHHQGGEGDGPACEEIEHSMKHACTYKYYGYKGS